jgi:hypothetical protein
MSQVGSHDPFGYLKHKLWPKKRSEIKLAIWLSTIKSRESTQFPCVQMVWDMPLESFQRWLQLCFKPHLNWRPTHKVMGAQSHKSLNFGNFRTPSPKTQCHLDVARVERHKIYYKGEGGGFPQVQVVENLVSPNLLVICPNTKSAPTMR